VTSKTVTVDELGEHLEQYFAEIREGTRIEVVDGGETVATIIPPLKFFKPGPRPKNLETDPAEMIIAERERERSGEKYK